MGIGIALALVGIIVFISFMVWLRQNLYSPDLNMFSISIFLTTGFICLGVGTFLAVWSRP
jgi:predicted membrane channel-forming protein YqfA (hemolysin III family)